MEVSHQQGSLFKATCGGHDILADQSEKDRGTLNSGAEVLL